jgi:hypothetical protein
MRRAHFVEAHDHRTRNGRADQGEGFVEWGNQFGTLQFPLQ